MRQRQPDTAGGSGEGDFADRRAALALVPVSRETEDRLALYVDRLRRWQGIVNLVGPATLPHVWTRHVADSAQLLALAPHARRWVDLGSGAGFPGLVIAVLLAGIPEARVDLIESNNRKCAFLREVARDTGAPAIVHAGRIEAVVPTLVGTVDVVTSRALAPVAALVALAEPLLAVGALGLFLGGDSAGAGPGEGAPFATDRWDVATHGSKTQSGSRIVVVRRSGTWETDD